MVSDAFIKTVVMAYCQSRNIDPTKDYRERFTEKDVYNILMEFAKILTDGEFYEKEIKKIRAEQEKFDKEAEAGLRALFE